VSVPLAIVDAFTVQPFAGNPAAVCRLHSEPDLAWAQRVAAEMNLSETAFAWPSADGAWGLRWFTPAAEVELCGHATLAAAHRLWEVSDAPPDQPIRFATAYRGSLTCHRGDDGGILMDFPADPPQPADAPAGLAEELGVEPVAVFRSRYDLMAVLPDEATVRDLRPDFAGLSRFDVRGVLVTAPAEPRPGDRGAADFVSRFFAPSLRIAEDPVTGSAHCVLAPYWAHRLGKRNLVGRQLSSRGGWVQCEHRDDRVWLGGQAVTVLVGELTEMAARGTSGGV